MTEATTNILIKEIDIELESLKEEIDKLSERYADASTVEGKMSLTGRLDWAFGAYAEYEKIKTDKYFLVENDDPKLALLIQMRYLTEWIARLADNPGRDSEQQVAGRISALRTVYLAAHYTLYDAIREEGE